MRKWVKITWQREPVKTGKFYKRYSSGKKKKKKNNPPITEKNIQETNLN